MNEIFILVIWTISIYAIRDPLNIIEVLSSFIISSTIMVYIAYWYYRRVPPFIYSAFSSDNDEKVSKAGYLMLLIAFGLIFVFGDITDPRAGYDVLVDHAREGSYILTLIKTVAILSLFLCYNPRNTLVVMIILSFLGSKGLLLQPLLVFLSYKLIRHQIISLKTFATLCLFGFIIYVFIDNYTPGISNIFSYYIYSYFDHTRNFQEISHLMPIAPNIESVIPFINDFLPGTSRITGVYKNALNAELFSEDFAVGKAAGLMRYEKFFRLGVAFIFLDVVLKIIYFEFFILVAASTKSVFLQRLVILAPSKRLIFIPTILFIVVKLCLQKRS